MNDQLQALDQATSTAIDLGLRFGPRLLVAALLVAAGVLAGRWAGRALLSGLARFELDAPVKNLLERIVRIFVLALFGIMALQNLGVEMLPLIAGLGVAGAGIALAMQGVLSNAAAGLTILFTRPFRAGDYIDIQKEEGEVLDITLFSTVLGHPDRSRVVIPNRKIVGEILHNYGRIRQPTLEFGIAYTADLAAAFAAIDEALRANARVLKDPAPVVAVARVAASQLTLLVKPWVAVNDYAPGTSEVNQAVLEGLRRRGVAMPVPQREVRMLAA